MLLRTDCFDYQIVRCISELGPNTGAVQVLEASLELRSRVWFLMMGRIYPKVRVNRIT